MGPPCHCREYRAGIAEVHRFTNLRWILPGHSVRAGRELSRNQTIYLEIFNLRSARLRCLPVFLFRNWRRHRMRAVSRGVSCFVVTPACSSSTPATSWSRARFLAGAAVFSTRNRPGSPYRGRREIPLLRFLGSSCSNVLARNAKDTPRRTGQIKCSQTNDCQVQVSGRIFQDAPARFQEHEEFFERQ